MSSWLGEEATPCVLITDIVHCVIEVFVFKVISPEVLCTVTASLRITTNEESMGCGQTDHTHSLLSIVSIKCSNMVPATVISEIIVDNVPLVVTVDSQDPASSAVLCYHITRNINHGGPGEVAMMAPRVRGHRVVVNLTPFVA